MESIEKLREYARNTKTVFAEPLAEIADEIEREILERYMKVPVDADGVPIRIGDELCLSNLTRGEVSALMLTPDGWEWELEGDDWYDIRFTNHVKPDPVKELLEEFADKIPFVWDGDKPKEAWLYDSLMDEYSARIREAVEK